jgi:hypothetical protein
LAAVVVASQRDMAVEKEAEDGVGTAVGGDAVGERAGGGAGKPHMNRGGGELKLLESSVLRDSPQPIDSSLGARLRRHLRRKAERSMSAGMSARTRGFTQDIQQSRS